ncbi:peptidase inhibitor family I36 protein [Amycolatopsis jiangsuensis]|nr:peptidase inhibitor family I36 protein [Amycolatopsis jiangsuensis]
MPQILSVVTAGLLASGGILAGAGAAQATPRHPAAASSQPTPPSTAPSCAVGEFCLWGDENYSGTAQNYDLRTANPGDCIPLPDGFAAHSFGNRMSRDVTIYQGPDCSTEGDFTTYPGGGTYVPQAPFVVRAVKIWE